MMGIWIEIHCDVKADGPPGYYGKNITQFCYSNRNDNPAGMVSNTIASVGRGLADIAWDASRNKGWKHIIRGGVNIWVCPNCKTTLPVKEEAT